MKCNKRYRKKFYEITKEYRKEHGEKGTKIKNLSSGQLKGVTRQYERLANKSKKNIEREHLKIINMLKSSKKKALIKEEILEKEYDYFD